VYVLRGDRVDRLVIEDVRFHRHRPIVRFAEVETMDAAEDLASAELRVPAEVLERLPQDTFYHHELIGCRVETLDGTVVGIVREVEGNDGLHRLIVEDGQTEVQIPLVDAICRQIDAAAQLITVDPPEGLLELNPPPRRPPRTSRRA
jgi:16S rRNA processing protein RimM